MGEYIYIAGPMTGLPRFNSDAFDRATVLLSRGGARVFNPAHEDRKVYGEDMFDRCPTGSVEESIALGFDYRAALTLDMDWICEYATAMYMLRGWENSKGARAEHALAVALGLDITYQDGR